MLITDINKDLLTTCEVIQLIISESPREEESAACRESKKVQSLGVIDWQVGFYRACSVTRPWQQFIQEHELIAAERKTIDAIYSLIQLSTQHRLCLRPGHAISHTFKKSSNALICLAPPIYQAPGNAALQRVLIGFVALKIQIQN